MLDEIRTAFQNALGALGVPVCGFDVNLPNDQAYGDVSTNAALVASKSVKFASRDLAGKVAELLSEDERFEMVWVAGPGFVNLRLSNDYLYATCRAIIAQGAAYGRGVGLGRYSACYVKTDPGPRQRWAAEVASSLASHLGYEASVVTSSTNVVSAQDELTALLDDTSQFGDATENELDSLANQLAVIQRAFEKADIVHYFSKQGGSFRPGLFEQLLATEMLKCTALEACGDTKPAAQGAKEGMAQLAKLFCISHRADRAITLDREIVERPGATNPAFQIHYAASLSRSQQSLSPSTAQSDTLTRELSKAEAQLVCNLAALPSVLQLAHERAEPHRLGLYLLQCARLLAEVRRATPERGSKAITASLLAAADVVFSVGLAIIDVEPLDEIS